MKTTRPKKITVLEKTDISQLVQLLIKYKKVTISNLCVLELKGNTVKEYYNVTTGEKQDSPKFRVNIKKARFLKDEIQKQLRK